MFTTTGPQYPATATHDTTNASAARRACRIVIIRPSHRKLVNKITTSVTCGIISPIAHNRYPVPHRNGAAKYGTCTTSPTPSPAAMNGTTSARRRPSGFNPGACHAIIAVATQDVPNENHSTDRGKLIKV